MIRIGSPYLNVLVCNYLQITPSKDGRDDLVANSLELHQHCLAMVILASGLAKGFDRVPTMRSREYLNVEFAS